MKKYLPFQSFWGIYNDIDLAHIPLSYATRFKPDLMDTINDPQRTVIPFAIVRNPYDRLWSAFQFEKTANWIPQNSLYYDCNLDINTFIKNNLPQIIQDQNIRFDQKRNLSLSGIHFIQQSLMIKPDANDILNVDNENLLRQEDVETDFTKFMRRMGALETDRECDEFVNQLKPQNCSNLVSPPKPYAYTQYYNSESIQLINDLYDGDFEAFGYEKVDTKYHDTKKLKGYFGGQSSGKL